MSNFVLIGSVGIDGTATIFESFLVLEDVPVTDPAMDKTYTVACLDNLGTILMESPFDVSFTAEDQPEPFTFLRTAFSLVCPFPKNTASVEIRREGKTLAALARSDTSPTLTNVKVTPSINFETDKQIQIEWWSADSSIDNITYSVSYSIDQGKSFRPIEGGLRESQLTVSTLGLGGSEGALIKVTASNGFDTVEAISDPFFLPKSPPVATILWPFEKANFDSDEPFLLRGVAFDLEDGLLNEESLQWFLAEPKETRFLGSGSELLVKPLSVGEYIVRLIATDSDGEQETVERLIVIQEAPLDK